MEARWDGMPRDGIHTTCLCLTRGGRAGRALHQTFASFRRPSLPVHVRVARGACSIHDGSFIQLLLDICLLLSHSSPFNTVRSTRVEPPPLLTGCSHSQARACFWEYPRNPEQFARETLWNSGDPLAMVQELIRGSQMFVAMATTPNKLSCSPDHRRQRRRPTSRVIMLAGSFNNTSAALEEFVP